MTPQEADAVRRRRDYGQQLLSRLQREEQTEFARSSSDPEFTTHELAKVTGKSERTVRRMLMGAGVGTLCKRPNRAGVPVVTLVVRWSQLEDLMREFGWAR